MITRKFISPGAFKAAGEATERYLAYLRRTGYHLSIHGRPGVGQFIVEHVDEGFAVTSNPIFSAQPVPEFR